MEKFLLALFALPEELDIIDDEHVNTAKLSLETEQITFLDCVDESVYEVFTTEQLNDCVGELSPRFAADGLQEMGFSEAGIAIDKKRVVGIAGRLADGNTACMRKSIARTDDEVIKGVIRVESKLNGLRWRVVVGTGSTVNRELDADKMPGNLLCSAGEADFAVFSEELQTGFVGTANDEQAAVEAKNTKVVKPRACVDRVERFGAVKDVSENVFCLTSRQAILLCKSVLLSNRGYPAQKSFRDFSHERITSPSAV